MCKRETVCEIKRQSGGMQDQVEFMQWKTGILVPKISWESQ